MAPERELQRLAARQHGLASRHQLLRLGYSSRQITGRVARGSWHRAAPRVYDVVPGTLDPRRALHAVVHRSRHLTASERTTVDGIACTSAMRTLLDLASVLTDAGLDDAIGRAIGRAIVVGRITMRRFEAYLRGPMNGRHGALALRAALERHRDRSGETRSLLEVLVDRAVTSGALPPPHRQHRVTIAGERFDLDLAWPDAKVFVEADGYAYHRNRKEFLHDRHRQNLLVVNGWLPLRYTWPVAHGRPATIVQQVGTTLTARGMSADARTAGGKTSKP